MRFSFLLLLSTMTLAQPPTGAARIWTSDEPAAVEARRLIAAGELARAEGALASSAIAEEGRDIIRRIRRDYSLNSFELLEKLGPQVKDLRLEDIESWTGRGELQFRRLDGEVRYFRREPANLMRFCEEAQKRRVRPVARPAFDLNDHLAKVIAAATQSGSATVLPVRQRVVFRLSVPAGSAALRKGALARAWLPFPQVYRQQSEVKLIETAPAAAVAAANGSAHRTIYLEQRVEDPAKGLAFEATFEFTCAAYYPALDAAKVEVLPAGFAKEYLAERRPHIAFTPAARELAKQIVEEETNPLLRARRIFHWVDANLRYNAEEEYAIIPSFSEHGLSRRRGDCGIQAAVFITLCRLAGIPARWQSGWQTTPGQENMHDWCEIYLHPHGWVPADPSYGLKQSDDPAVREFYLGHLDSHRMIVNLDYGAALTPPKQSIRSEPADFQRGEIEIDGKNLYFDQWDYDLRVR